MTGPRRSPAARGAVRDVIRADKADLDVLSHVIAHAFFDLAPSRWLIADPADRCHIFPFYFRLYLEHALASGTVLTTPGRTAAALWIPGGLGTAGFPDGHAGRLAALTSPWTSRFLAFDEALDRHHPSGTSHRHPAILAILAVHPNQQGRGIGTALLHAGHATLDAADMPAYLEASSPRVRDLYLAHGYIPRPDAPFDLPDGGPPMWPMWRHPRPRASRHDHQPAPQPHWPGRNAG